MRKRYLLVVIALATLLCLCIGNVAAQGRPFVIKWHASEPNKLKIPIYGKYKLKIIHPSGYLEERDIDGEIYNELKGATGDYTIKAGPEGVERICMSDVGFDAQHFTEVVDFGTVKWKSMNNAFYGCSGLKFKEGIQPPELSQVTDMSGMFAFCTSFNQSFINDWDVSNVTNMEAMFRGCTSFNQSLGAWKIKTVESDLNNTAMDIANDSATLVGWAAWAEEGDIRDLHFGNNVSRLTYNAEGAAARKKLIARGLTFENNQERSLSFNVKTASFIPNEEAKLIIEVIGLNGTPTVTIEGESGVMEILSVTETVFKNIYYVEVKALKPGSVKLKAKLEDCEAECTVTVEGENVKVGSIEVNPKDSYLRVGETVTLQATIYPNNATEKGVTWRSNNSQVATVDQNGLVTAKGLGDCYIFAKTKEAGSNVEDLCHVYVQGIKSVKITNAKASLKVHDKYTFTAAVDSKSWDLSNKVTWKCNNTELATIDENSGELTALAPGQVTITATSKDDPTKMASCEVTLEGVKSIAITESKTPLKVAEKSSFKATVEVVGEVATTVKWSTSDDKIAQVDENTGKVTAVAPGKATITATSTADATKKATVEVTVEGVKSIAITESKTPLKVEEKSTFKATVEVAGEVATTVKWSTSDDKIAQVDETTGDVTAVAPGKATITATSTADDTKKATVEVTVEGVKSIAITESKTPLKVEEKSSFKATVEVAGEVATTVKWSTSDDKVAQVDETTGEVTAVAPGNATITATSTADATKKAAVDVTVVEKEIHVETVTVKPSKCSLNVGQTQQLEVEFTPANATHQEKSFAVTKGSEFVTVSTSGLITAVKAGEAEVTATVDGVTATCQVTVTTPAPPTPQPQPNPQPNPTPNPQPETFAVKLVQPVHGTLAIKGYTEETLKAVAKGTELTVVAVPKNEGGITYELKELKANGVNIQATKKFTVTAATTVTAVFEKKQGTAVEDALLAHISVAPNPFTTQLRILNPDGGTVHYKLTNSLGVVKSSGVLLETETVLDTETLPSSIYFVHLEAHEGVQKTIKVIRY